MGSSKSPPFSISGNTLRLGTTSTGKSVEDVKFKLTIADLKSLIMNGSETAYLRPFKATALGSGSVRRRESK